MTKPDSEMHTAQTEIESVYFRDNVKLPGLGPDHSLATGYSLKGRADGESKLKISMQTNGILFTAPSGNATLVAWACVNYVVYAAK